MQLLEEGLYHHQVHYCGYSIFVRFSDNGCGHVGIVPDIGNNVGSGTYHNAPLESILIDARVWVDGQIISNMNNLKVTIMMIESEYEERAQRNQYKT